MEIFTVKDLSFTYAGAQRPTLRGVSLRVSPGEFVLLAGPTGCGKTTLLRLLKHSVAPVGERAGDILFCGKDVRGLGARELVSEIGFVFQNPDTQIVCKTAYAELHYGAENIGLSAAQTSRAIAEVACYFGMGDLLDRNVASLSGGQKQLLNLAAALILRPKVLILDEPTAQIDPVYAAEFLAVLRRINQETGMAVLLSEQTLEEAFPIADRVLVMEDGRVADDGPARAVASRLLKSDAPVAAALPAPVRLYGALGGGEEPVPLTIKQARTMLAARPGAASVSAPAPAQPGRPAVEVRHVRFRYDRSASDILRDASLRANYGELLALHGANGAGKTTLLRLLSGRYRPWHGSVRYENRDAAKVYLPQNPRLSFLKDTLAEDVAFLLEQAGLPSGRADELMRRFPFFARLGPLMRSNPLDLSGGQQQMAAVFKAMLAEPDVLLLDEPTKGLDARLKNELAALLGTLKSAGVCMIMASHDVEFAAAVADRCAMLFSGVIVQDDAPYDFFVSNRFYTTGLCKITNGILEQPAVRFSDLAANREAYV